RRPDRVAAGHEETVAENGPEVGGLLPPDPDGPAAEPADRAPEREYAVGRSDRGSDRAGATAPAPDPPGPPERTRSGHRDRARQRRDGGGVAGLQPAEAHRPSRRPRTAPAGAERPVHEGVASGRGAGASTDAGGEGCVARGCFFRATKSRRDAAFFVAVA